MSVAKDSRPLLHALSLVCQLYIIQHLISPIYSMISPTYRCKLLISQRLPSNSLLKLLPRTAHFPPLTQVHVSTIVSDLNMVAPLLVRMQLKDETTHILCTRLTVQSVSIAPPILLLHTPSTRYVEPQQQRAHIPIMCTHHPPLVLHLRGAINPTTKVIQNVNELLVVVGTGKPPRYLEMVVPLVYMLHVVVVLLSDLNRNLPVEVFVYYHLTVERLHSRQVHLTERYTKHSGKLHHEGVVSEVHLVKLNRVVFDILHFVLSLKIAGPPHHPWIVAHSNRKIPLRQRILPLNCISSVSIRRQVELGLDLRHPPAHAKGVHSHKLRLHTHQSTINISRVDLYLPGYILLAEKAKPFDIIPPKHPAKVAVLPHAHCCQLPTVVVYLISIVLVVERVPSPMPEHTHHLLQLAHHPHRPTNHQEQPPMHQHHLIIYPPQSHMPSSLPSSTHLDPPCQLIASSGVYLCLLVAPIIDLRYFSSLRHY